MLRKSKGTTSFQYEFFDTPTSFSISLLKKESQFSIPPIQCIRLTSQARQSPQEARVLPRFISCGIVATFRVTHLWCKLLIGNYFYWKGGTIIIRVHYKIPILRYCIISLPFLSLHRINFILMIRNKHDIPQGYGFPLSQAHRSREK